MKKLLFTSSAIFVALAAMAQNGKVISAYNYMDAYNNKEGNANLEEAAKNIDIAVNDESTAGSTKAWWYRAEIYQLMSTDTSFRAKYPKASLEALHSFQKMKELNEPKFKDWSDAITNMKILNNNLFNDGINAFTRKNYHDAFLFFSGVADLQDILVAKGEKPNNDILEKSLGNAALSAENDNDLASAVVVYRKELPLSIDAKPYMALVSLLKKQKDIEGAKKVTDEGLVKYPTDKDLLIDKVNFYMTDGKYADALAYLQKIAAQDPKNEQVQAAIGTAYDQMNDTVNARKTYEYLLTLNPNNFEANFGIGRLIFNRSKPIQEQLNNLGTSKEDIKKDGELKAVRNAIFLEAKPYLDRANTARPDDPEIKKALNTIEAMTRK